MIQVAGGIALVFLALAVISVFDKAILTILGKTLGALILSVIVGALTLAIIGICLLFRNAFLFWNT